MSREMGKNKIRRKHKHAYNLYLTMKNCNVWL